MASASRTREWDDPTFWAVVRRDDANRRRVRYAHVITRVTATRRLFWNGQQWTDDYLQAHHYISDNSAWNVAECLQDGSVDVELLPDPNS